jgi:hypothetical protein
MAVAELTPIIVGTRPTRSRVTRQELAPLLAGEQLDNRQRGRETPAPSSGYQLPATGYSSSS